MNPTGKKFISLFLVFSLMMLSTNLSAKEKRGATLLITKKDGRGIEGELIAIRKNLLLIIKITSYCPINTFHHLLYQGAPRMVMPH